MARIDDTRARSVPGVLDVVRIDGGVAVVATSWWPAQKALDLLELEFEGGDAGATTATIGNALAAAIADGPRAGRVRVDKGVSVRAMGHQSKYPLKPGEM